MSRKIQSYSAWELACALGAAIDRGILGDVCSCRFCSPLRRAGLLEWQEFYTRDGEKDRIVWWAGTPLPYTWRELRKAAREGPLSL